MRIRIITFQTDPNCVFHISHKFILYVEQRLNELFFGLNPDLNLDLSIICISDNVEDLKLGDHIKQKGSGKNVTLQIILPNKYLYFEPDYVFNSKKFDFVFKNQGYQTYPLDLYSRYVITGVLNFLYVNKLDSPGHNEVNSFANTLEANAVSKSNYFKFENEEFMHLREIKEKTHWAFENDEGKEWLESEIGQNWIKLAEKYSFDEDGMLMLNPA